MECLETNDGMGVTGPGIPLISDYPSNIAERFPDKTALVFDDRRVSYAELSAASDAFSAAILQRGLKGGERVAWLGKNTHLFFVTLFGCIRAGMVLLPINWRCSASEVAFMLEDSEASLLIYDDEFTELVQKARKLCASPPELVTMAVVEDILATGRGVSLDRRVLDANAIILHLYTSGTTGRPKGVLLTHRALSALREIEARALLPEDDWTEEAVIMSMLPVAHVAGIGWVLIGLRLGMTCVLTADASPKNIIELVRRHRVTNIFMVPTIIRSVIAELDAEGGGLPGLRVIHYGSAPMDLALIRRCIELFGCRFGQHFGMTELGGTAAFLGASDHDLARPELLRSVGRPLPEIMIEIRRDDGGACAAGETGEIWLKSPAAMHGYWNLPDATAAALIDGWYRTGDGGYLDPDGFLYLTDRIKDFIITGGENVYPTEVEAILRRHPAVQDVAVIGIPDEKWGELVTAVIQLRPGHTLTIGELRSYSREFLASYKCPKIAKSIPALPRTSVGKIQRQEVKKRAATLPLLD